MRVNIEDRWLRKSATAAARRALASARDPMRARVPEAMRTTEFGKGMRWRVTWYADRERRRRSFASRKDAEAFAASLEDDIRSGRYVDPRDMERTIGSAGEAGFALLVPVVKPATWNRYRRDWDTHVAPYWGDRPLSALTPSALGSWIASLADGSARSCHGVMLSTSSIRGIHRALSVAVDHAMSNGWLQSDPLKAVKWPRKGQSKRVYLTVAQVGRLADAAGVHGIDILLLAYTGIRIGEALALRVADVDLRRRRITVARTKTVGREGNAETVGPTKNGQVRRVPIPPMLEDGLRELTAGRDGGEPLLVSPRGNMWGESNWRNRVWRPAVRAAGLDRVEGLTVHSLRHTYASMAIAGGADVKTLQKAMGHSSASITLDVYADLWPDRLDDVADAIGRVVSRGDSGAMTARGVEGSGGRTAE